MKLLIIIVNFLLLAASFAAGVKYSDSVKNHAGWIFETKEEVELPDLSDENTGETGAVTEENGASDQMVAPQDSTPVDAIELDNKTR